MLLENLINEKEKSLSILIEDNLKFPGRACIKAYLTALSQRYNAVIVLLTEVNQEAYCEGLPPSTLSRLHFIDYASNPDDWEWCEDPEKRRLQIQNKTNIYEAVTSLHKLGGEAAIVIDSLDKIVLNRSAPYTCQTLKRLSHHGLDEKDCLIVKQVISLVHADLHDEATLKLLRHISNSCITMCEPKDTLSYLFASKIIHKRETGKVLVSEEQYNISDNFSLQDVAEVFHLKKQQSNDPEPDPTANLTFNLSLSSKEKEARSQLVLPYLRKEEKKVDLSNSSAKIFYQPDDADDFDEEDPDDDLDI